MLQQRFLQQLWAVLWKELTVELRTREILYTTLLFGAIIVVIFTFGFIDRAAARSAAPGVLWISILFAGTVSLNRTFERERESASMAALTLVPGLAPALFFGKLLANILFIFILELLVAPMVLVMFQLTNVPYLGTLGLVLTLGVIGYATLGTLVGAMLTHVKLRAILLPLVLFPLVIPILGLGVTSSGLLLGGHADGAQYLGVMAAFDLLLLVVSVWLFDRLIDTI